VLATLFSLVGIVKLFKLLAETLEHALLLLLAHTLHLSSLLQLVLAILNAILQAQQLVVEKRFLLVLAANHLFVVDILGVEFLVNLGLDVLALEVNVAKTAVLVSALHLFKLFQGTFFVG